MKIYREVNKKISLRQILFRVKHFTSYFRIKQQRYGAFKQC